MYRYRMSCDQCGGDPHGCFGGDYQISTETFETPEHAASAGQMKASGCESWHMQVVDEQGKALPVPWESQALDQLWLLLHQRQGKMVVLDEQPCTLVAAHDSYTTAMPYYHILTLLLRDAAGHQHTLQFSTAYQQGENAHASE